MININYNIKYHYMTINKNYAAMNDYILLEIASFWESI